MPHENVKPCSLRPFHNLLRSSRGRTSVCRDETRLSIVSPLEDHSVLVTSFIPLHEAVCAFLRMRETHASPGGRLPCRHERRRPGVRWEWKQSRSIGREERRGKSERLALEKGADKWLLDVRHGCGRPPIGYWWTYPPQPRPLPRPYIFLLLL
jgi:hypothetical protein